MPADLSVICGISPLWDWNLTWNTTTPDVTVCFQTTILSWVPCSLFIFMALQEFIKASRSIRAPNKLSVVHVLKQIINIVITVATCIKLVSYFKLYSLSQNEYHIAGIIAGAIELIALIVLLILTFYTRKKGLLVSNAIPIFWTLQCIAFGTCLYSACQKTLWLDGTFQCLLVGALFVQVPLSLVQLVLTSLEEKASGFQRLNADDHQENYCPAEHNSFFSFITYSWATKLLIEGFRNTLQLGNIPALCKDAQSATTTKIFDNIFIPKSVQNLRSNNRLNDPDVTFALNKKNPSLMFSLLRMACWPFSLGAVFELCTILASFAAPFLLHKLLDFVQSNEIVWHGFLYALLFWLSTVVSTMFDSLSMYFCTLASVQVKSTLISCVYRKILLLSNTAKKRYTCGDIVNLMAIDSEEVFGFTSYIYQFAGVPLRVALTVYFLWNYLGPSCLASFAVFAVLSPLSYCIGRKIDYLQGKVMEKKDQRMKQMAEILNGMKVLKLYAWEKPFIKEVLKTRNEELGYTRKACYIDSFFVFLWVVAPFLVCAVCFSTFLLSSSSHVLDVQTAFVSLTLFNLLRYPMGVLPDLLTRFVKCLVSLKRLNEFLFANEIDPFLVNNQPDAGDAVTIRDATFAWDIAESSILKNISLRVAKGSLVAIVGPVGCGKSSLLSAILGEMQKSCGTISRKGRIAYVPQLAWIQNASLQKNVVFKKPLIEKHYDCVIKSCALQPDIELLVGGDKTEIGEKGINLSGGQKQRVSLARAVYQDEDIYLLDDSLSAVDANVAHQLFNQVIGSNGMLKKKTRILATHNISYLSEMDHIVVMADGEIIEQGSYSNLMESKGKLAEFLNQHMHQGKKESDSKKNLVTKQLSVVSSHSESSQNEENVANDNAQLTEEETMQTGKVKWGVYKQYIQSIGVLMFLAILLVNASSVGFETGSGVWLSHWSTEVMDRPAQLKGLEIYIGMILALAVSAFLCYIVLFYGTIRAAKKLHERLLYSIMKSPLSFFDTTPTGRILNRFSKDVESIDQEIPFSLGMTLNNLFWLPTITIIICLTSVYLLPFLGVAFVIYIFILRGYIATSNQVRRLDSVSRSPVYANFTETIQGASSIRAYNAQTFFINRSFERVDENLKCYYNKNLLGRWLDNALTFVASFIILGTTFICVLERENIGPGVLGLALTYCAEISAGFSWLVKIGAMMESQIVGLERILEYSVLPSESTWEIEETKPSSEWPQNGNIQIHNYSTIYREGLDPVLKNINLSIDPGIKLGVVGRTGAGKSSFILSLFRILEPISGEIIIDDIDITKIGVHDLRSKLTVIPQDPVLFAGSLRMNLDPFLEHTNEEIWRSLEFSHLKSFVTTLPEELEHKITEGGENLSAGQRQLICLARALLRRTKILILDEATASVDLDTDNLIQETVRQAFADCTVIIIAHRLHTIMKCDKIICFSQGQLVEEGSPDELIKDQSSHFYSMAKDAGLV